MGRQKAPGLRENLGKVFRPLTFLPSAFSHSMKHSRLSTWSSARMSANSLTAWAAILWAVKSRWTSALF